MNKKIPLLTGLLAVILLACACPVTPLFTPTPTSPPPPSPSAASADETLPPPIADDNPVFAYPWADRLPFQANLSAPAQSALTGLEGASVYHLALSFGSPPNRALGKQEVLYTNTEAVPLEEIYLALFPNLLGGRILIQETLLNGEPVTPEIRDWLMRLPLDRPLQPGESVILRIGFEVRVPSSGGNYYYGIFGYNDGILSFAHAYPTILVYNAEGWNNQAPDLDGDPLFADASFYLVSVDAPIGWTLVAAGTEIERIETADRQQVLIANAPARDFYLAASRDLVKLSQATETGVTVNAYAPSGQGRGNQTALEHGVAAIETFSRRYGAYPYTEFDIAPIVTAAGGVEYPGMTAIAANAYNWGDFLEIVIVHEAAHMWFYNLVGNDTLDQPWLDESLAQFATWQYYLDRHGAAAADAFRQMDLQSRWDFAQNPDTPIGLPVSAYPGDDYASIVYGRGALFFLALRERMGVERFDGFLRDYVARFAWSIASSDGFKALAEQHCRCDLSLLFDEWVYP